MGLFSIVARRGKTPTQQGLAGGYSTNLVEFAPTCPDPNSLPKNAAEAIALAEKIESYKEDLAATVAANQRTLKALAEIAKLEAKQQREFSKYAVVAEASRAQQRQTIDQRQQAIQRLQAGILKAMEEA